MSTTEWTSFGDVIQRLDRRWARGNDLRAHARGEPFVPFRIALRAPGASDLVDRLDDVRRWAAEFDAANGTGTRRQVLGLEHRVLRNRVFGDNPVPARVFVESLEQFGRVLGNSYEVERLDRVLAITRLVRPELVDWVCEHPFQVISHHDVWIPLLDAVGVMVDTDLGETDLRHLDLPGLDTKFVERHRVILRKLLDRCLPPDQIDTTSPTFAGRYGFRARPTYARLRLLRPVPELPAVLTEMEVRVDELAQLELSVGTVFIVENQATYLNFPDVPDAIVVFGGGFGVTVLDGVPWLAERNVVYWGDIDTHGFAILSRLRERVPTVRSLLMDRSTLLAHRDRFVVEPNPTAVELLGLDTDERELYRALVEDRFGPAVRLEQERIGMATVLAALHPWLAGPPS